MIYTPMTRKAAAVAYDAHHGHIDDGGLPYIMHPLHLAEGMDDELSTCVALLHDVVEHTDVTFDDLEGEFPPEVIRALRLLTHDERTDYMDYVRGIKGDSLAVKVKLADLDHNSDRTRFEGTVPDDVVDSWIERYDAARRILKEE